MSWWKPLAKIAAGVAAPFTGGASLAAIPAIDALGKAAGGATDSMAANRGTQLDVEFEKLREQRMQEDAFFRELMNRENLRDTRSDSAWKRMQQADYITNRTPQAGVSPYTRALQPIGADTTAMAADPSFRAQLLQRVNFADPYAGQMPTRTPNFSGVENKRNPSIWEKILGAGSAAATIYGGLSGAGKGTK